MIWERKKTLFNMGVVVFFVLGIVTVVNAQMQSQNYEINWDSINSGGLDNSTSTNYLLRDSLGQLVSGFSTSTNYELSSGYRTPGRDEDVLTFTVEAEDSGTQVAYTIFDDPGLTVTVSSAAGYGEGDRIVVVEDKGAEQLIAIGKIAGIAGSNITVDAWEGENEIMSLNAGGGDDFVYKLSGNSVDFETLSFNSIQTGVSYFEVTSNYGSGYTVYVKENQDLQDGGSQLKDVADGVVTAGTEEYGIETIGQYSQGSGDFAITSSKQAVATKTGIAQEEKTGIIYKAGIDTNTTDGNYAHTVSYYCTVNF